MLMKWRGFNRDQVALSSAASRSSSSSSSSNLQAGTVSSASSTRLADSMEPLSDSADIPDASPSSRVPQSQPISPNLDALLEDDEHLGTAERPPSPSTRGSVPDPTAGLPTGLPPPPRGPRKGKKKASPEGTYGQTRQQSSMDSTVSPLLADWAAMLELPTSLHFSSLPHANSPSSPQPSVKHDSITNPVVTMSLMPGATTLTSSDRMETWDREESPLLSRSMHSNDASPNVSGSSFEDQPLVSSQEGEDCSRNEYRNEQTATSIDTLSRDSMEQLSVPLSSATPFTSSDFDTKARRRTRPFLSHAHSYSQDSGYSHSSLSSHDPPSTADEPRISISSTIYPPSSYADSMTYSPSRATGQLVQNTPLIFYPSDDPGPSNANADHESDLSPPIYKFVQLPSGTPSAGSAAESLEAPPIPRRDHALPIPPSIRSLPDDLLCSHANTIPSPILLPLDKPKPSQLGKPPLPTSPKPLFARSTSAPRPSSSRSSKSSRLSSPTTSPKLAILIPHNILTSRTKDDHGINGILPPTTNVLNPEERAELVRKTRKLTQVFGQTPTAASIQPDSPLLVNCLPPIIPSRRNAHQRGHLSMSGEIPVAATHPCSQWNGRTEQLPASPNDARKRYASPLSPMIFRESFALHGEDEAGGITPSFESLSDYSSEANNSAGSAERHKREARTPDSSISFMNIDDEYLSDHHSPALVSNIHRRAQVEYSYKMVMSSPSIPSLFEPMSKERNTEGDRRRKREKLAKLHRFLGSRVPTELVLGQSEMGVPLPALAPPTFEDAHAFSDGEAGSSKKVWMRQRRRSASVSFSSRWSSSPERLKEDLDNGEKAINVRRALKMGKMFGEQPPQTLYHTRRSPSPLHISGGLAAVKPSDGLNRRASGISNSAPSSPSSRNLNRSAYTKSKLTRSRNRPGTAESRKELLPSQDSHDLEIDSPSSNTFPYISPVQPMSDTYMHYRHSLNSLTDIIDRDDKQSLAQLHEFINTDLSCVHDECISPSDPTPSLRADRRHSLPLRPSLASLASLASQDTIISPKPKLTAFQIRRRRAAKLSHFFGANYRELFGEVLDSIEMGVKEDGGKGALRLDEVQALLLKVQTLKTRRDEIANF